MAGAIIKGPTVGAFPFFVRDTPQVGAVDAIFLCEPMEIACGVNDPIWRNEGVGSAGFIVSGWLCSEECVSIAFVSGLPSLGDCFGRIARQATSRCKFGTVFGVECFANVCGADSGSMLRRLRYTFGTRWAIGDGICVIERPGTGVVQVELFALCDTFYVGLFNDAKRECFGAVSDPGALQMFVVVIPTVQPPPVRISSLCEVYGGADVFLVMAYTTGMTWGIWRSSVRTLLQRRGILPHPSAGVVCVNEISGCV